MPNYIDHMELRLRYKYNFPLEEMLGSPSESILIGGLINDFRKGGFTSANNTLQSIKSTTHASKVLRNLIALLCRACETEARNCSLNISKAKYLLASAIYQGRNMADFKARGQLLLKAMDEILPRITRLELAEIEASRKRLGIDPQSLQRLQRKVERYVKKHGSVVVDRQQEQASHRAKRAKLAT